MRPYKQKKDIQKKAYYSDRFWVAPRLEQKSVESDEVFESDVKSLKSRFEIILAYIQKGQLVVYVNASDIKEIMKHLKDELEYNFLSELSANDYLAERGGFEVFYQMLSTSKRKRMRVKCFVKEEQAVESVSSIYKSADWAEREMYDMLGVKVNNHPYLKRILMPDDWVGHPLRKDYPLQGDEAAQWYEIDKIFGREYREVVGEEIRDAGRVDRYDTKRYAKIKHEVGYGQEYSDKPTTTEYQEEGGVFLIDRFKKSDSEQLKERR